MMSSRVCNMPGQWQRIEPLLPALAGGFTVQGRPPRNRRQIVNGLLYLQDGVSLGFVTLLFWAVENDYFRRWSLQGVWMIS